MLSCPVLSCPVLSCARKPTDCLKRVEKETRHWNMCFAILSKRRHTDAMWLGSCSSLDRIKTLQGARNVCLLKTTKAVSTYFMAFLR
jgi:hypothetical protein